MTHPTPLPACEYRVWLSWCGACGQEPGGCFTNVSRALQNNLAKIHNTRNHIYGENFKLKLCTWLWAHVQRFSLKFSSQVLFLQYTNFKRIFWRARETLGKQHPGLRLSGRSPGVPDKSSRGLCSMSRYSAETFICFIAYIFHLFYSSVGWVVNFAGLPLCTVPSVVVHYNQNEADRQTVKAHVNTLAFMTQDWWNWEIKWMKSISMGSVQYKSQVKGEFCIP